MALVLAGLVPPPLTPPAAAQQAGQPLRLTLPPGVNVRRAADQAMSLLAFAAVPDGTASTIQINRNGGDADSGVRLGQFGAGFTVSESFPLYLEGFIGFARYDPRFVFSDGQQTRRLPTRWNDVATTIGVGYDIKLARNLYLRPIINGTLGYVSSDANLLGSLIDYKADRDLAFLHRGAMGVWGAGGSLMLAYYDHLPAREIDVELRYTHLHLTGFGAGGHTIGTESDARTVNLWGRLRWPTGAEVFNRPLRYVLEGQHSIFLDSQRDVLGFSNLTKLGGGLEIDAATLEIGAFGFNVQRLRLVGRFVFGEDVRGFSIGLGISF